MRAKKGGAKTNIVFWVLVVAGLVLVWFCASPLFKPIGKYFLDLFNDAKDTINEEEENDES